MEANELMIGDYLRTRFSKKIIRVKEIKQSCIYTEDNGYEYNEIEPIPITPEILEKNGWVKNLYSVESYDNEELECLSLWVGEDGKNKWWWHVGVELVTPINYVHELQHTLRLCGIEKEIIL